MPNRKPPAAARRLTETQTGVTGMAGQVPPDSEIADREIILAAGKMGPLAGAAAEADPMPAGTRNAAVDVASGADTLRILELNLSLRSAAVARKLRWDGDVPRPDPLLNRLLGGLGQVRDALAARRGLAPIEAAGASL